MIKARKRFAFDMNKALQYAWDVRWTGNIARRQRDLEYEKKTGKKSYGWAQSYYLTASDIERTVRDLAEFTQRGEPWPTDPEKLGYGYGNGIRFPSNLQNVVRNWLFSNRKLTHHNFGRGHISGARFRPVGEPLAEAELATMVNKQRKRDPNYKAPVHFRCDSPWRSLCTHKRMEGKRRSFFGGRGRSQAWCNEDKEKVTCKQCLNILASNYVVPVRKQHSAETGL